ncbi:hypothetical protein [Kitasatospora sp. GP82]|uniref:hypothetical protein n=1 Tax=Kitasatospora sp. GP82 TaxID=3035089 RepID=UPI002473253C|nr:hypothetical protein [Kitasatospora sp. GP82]MDH6126369.1 hypothetical protein [Kitasatospora sp. GP82]
MGDIERTAIAAAYQLAEPSMIGVLMGRSRGGTVELLRHEYELPRRLTDAVIASGDQELQVALASNHSGAAGMRKAHLRLARLGDPEVGRALYKAQWWADSSDEIRAAVLAGADPADPAWRSPGGLVDEVLDASGRNVRLPALRAPFPELVACALHQHGEILPPSMVVAACRAVLVHGGRDSLSALADLVPDWNELGHPGLAALLRRAVADPDPAAVLHGEPSATDEIMYLARTHAGWRLPQGVPVAWDEVCAEHRRRPFSPDAIMALNRFPGCPQDLAVAGFRADPAGTMARGGGPLPPSVLIEPDLALDPYLASYRLSQALRGGFAEGWLSAGWMLAEVRPAALALECLPEVTTADEGVRKAVGELVAPLGADPAAWIALYRLVGRFQGPAEALVAAACAEAERGAAASWPRPLAAAFPSREPESARRIFQVLLEHAEQHVQEALVPYLDGRAIQHLLVFGHPSRRVRDRITAVHGRPSQIGHASRWDLPAEAVEELLDLDDPEVNAKLYIYGAIAQQERMRILAGRGRRGDSVPVAPGLLDDLLEVKAAHRRDWLTAGHLSGDPRVLRVTLSRCRLHTEGGRLRTLIRLWERHGPQEVESFLDEQRFPGRSNPKHPLPATTHKTVRQALAAPDGLAVLRSRLAAEEAPERLVALLRKAAAGSVADRVRHLVAEGTVLPWPQLTQAHTAEPFSASLLAALGAVRDCPRILLLAALRAQVLQPRAEGMDWLSQALDDGRLTTADVLQHARPAPTVLAFLTATDINYRPAVPRWRPPHREAAELLREHLGADPEAWAAALHLLPGFTGSLPELLATTAAAGA